MPLRNLLFFGSVLALAVFSGCTTLVGTVSPVTERDSTYSIYELDRVSPHWKKIAEGRGEADEEKAMGLPDVTYQSSVTHSTISLSSSCRERQGDSSLELEKFSEQLFYGISSVKNKTTQPRKVADRPALETTLEGIMDKRKIKLRVIVLSHDDCIYDLMYLTSPQFFDDEIMDFEQFVLRFKL